VSPMIIPTLEYRPCTLDRLPARDPAPPTGPHPGNTGASTTMAMGFTDGNRERESRCQKCSSVFLGKEFMDEPAAQSDPEKNVEEADGDGSNTCQSSDESGLWA